MTHNIDIKEDKNGYYTVMINGRGIAYGLTKDQAGWFIRGIEFGIEESDHTFLRSDNFYVTFAS
jgi:hypothetical protein